MSATWADQARQRRDIARQQTLRRHLSWVAGALAVGLSALIVASALVRPAATLAPTDGDAPTFRVWVSVDNTCAPIHTMYIDETPECEQP